MPDAAARKKRRAAPGLLSLCLLLLLVASLGVAAEAGAQSEIRGIDVSNWQRQIDWLAVAGTGTAFAFAKATEGTTYSDPTFALNRSGAKGVGIRFGAYHFARPSGSTDAAAVASATAQADYFLSVAQPVPGELLPAVDLEDAGGLDVERLSLWAQVWLSHVVARTGVKPVVYVSPSFWKTRLGDSPVAGVAGHRLWIAHWTKEALPILPGASWGGLGWSFWQWSNCQKIAGIAGCVDGNRFNGSSLAGVVVPAYPPGLPSRTAPPTIVGQPQAGKLLSALPGAWNGGKPVTFGYQWQRCNAAGGACSSVATATSASYTPSAADVGRALVVRVSAVSATGSVSATSAPTLAVSGSGAPGGTTPRALVLPSIGGSTEVGQTLTALPGTWTGAPTSFSYQWRRCGADGRACTTIEGAGRSTYTISPGDIGSALAVTVTAVGKGGAGSATSAPSAIVTPAPVPEPTVGTAVAQAGQAGSVATATTVAAATWQPGTLPAQATVGLADTPSRLALRGTAVKLEVRAPTPLPWPIDLRYTAAPPDAVPGILPLEGVWQPLARLPSPRLPAAQQAGAYRDATGALHVLTRTAGRIALFAAGKWGDPRYATAFKPRVAVVNAFTVRRADDGSATVLGRITLDTQAHLYVGLIGAGGAPLLLPQKTARIGWWLQGKPAKTLQALQLSPGALPIRLRVPAAQLRGAAPLTLRIVAIDPYGRRSTLRVRIA